MDDVGNTSFGINDKDGNTIISTDDMYRVAMMGNEFWIEDSNGKIYYYDKFGKQIKGNSKSKPSPNPKPTSLDSYHIGVVLSLLYWPDYFKETLSEGIMIGGSNETEIGGEDSSYNAIWGQGDPTSILEYKYSGDALTYRYVDTSNPDLAVADMPIVTKTISINRLIKDYYNNDDKKDEVDNYVKKLRDNTEQYHQQNNY